MGGAGRASLAMTLLDAYCLDELRRSNARSGSASCWRHGAADPTVDGDRRSDLLDADAGLEALASSGKFDLSAHGQARAAVLAALVRKAAELSSRGSS